MMWAHRRVLMASLVGTAVEFYDFYIYATAASLVFGPLFFPLQLTRNAAHGLLCQLCRGVFRTASGRGGVSGHYRQPDRAQIHACRLANADGPLDPRCRFPADLSGNRVLGAFAAVRHAVRSAFGWAANGAARLCWEDAPPGWRARFGMVPQLGAPVIHLRQRAFSRAGAFSG